MGGRLDNQNLKLFDFWMTDNTVHFVLPPVLGPNCYEEPTYLNKILCTVLVVGVGVTFFPQWQKIYKRKTSEGVSFITFGILFLANFFVTQNSVLLRQEKLLCCSELTGVLCVLNNLATLQLAVTTLALTVSYTLILRYFPQTSDEGAPRTKSKSIAYLWIMFCALLAILSVVGFFIYTNGGKGEQTRIWRERYAHAMGVLAAICQASVWAPQLYTSCKMKDEGSLSLTSLSFTTLGSFLILTFQTVVNNAPFSTAIPFVISLCELVPLILYLAYLKIRKPKTIQVY